MRVYDVHQIFSYIKEAEDVCVFMEGSKLGIREYLRALYRKSNSTNNLYASLLYCIIENSYTSFKIKINYNFSQKFLRSYDDAIFVTFNS
jgi:hypothetical protein